MYVAFTYFISMGVILTLLGKGFLRTIKRLTDIFVHVLWLEYSSCAIYYFIEVFIDYYRLADLNASFFL